MLSANELWVTSIIRRAPANSPFIKSVVALGWIPIVTTAYVLTFGSPSLSFIIAQSLTASVVVTGPYQAYKFDTDVLPHFFEDCAELISEPDRNQLQSLQREYESAFRTGHIPFVALWTLAVISVLILNRSYFAAQGIIPGTAVSIGYLIFLLNFGVLSGLGLYSVIIMIRSIRSVSKLSIEIEPLHPDGLGGLSVIGNSAIWSTLLISNGALAIPLALQMVTSNIGGVVVYLGTGIYIALIVTSFIYPTLKINRRAQEIRDSHLEEYRSEIRRLEAELSEIITTDSVTTKELALQMEIERTRKEFQNYRDVRLYPLSIGIVTRLLSSILLPIGFTIFELYISRLL